MANMPLVRLVSGPISYVSVCGYPQGFLGDGASNDSGGNFRHFLVATFSETLEKGQHYYMDVSNPLHLPACN